MLPEIVDLRLVGACDLRCPFCFGPRHGFAPMQSDAVLALLPKLTAAGVKNIVITGGEPTLIKDLPLYLRTAKELGLGTVLSTNGIRFRERAEALAPYLDWIGLPLDGDNAIANNIVRIGRKDHFSHLIELMPLLKREYPHLKVKLGTVVTALNRDSILGIPTLLSNIGIPDVWKLYQVVYSSYGSDNRELLALSDCEYEQTLALATSAAQVYGVRVAAYRRQDRSGKYMFVEPDGAVIVIGPEGEHSIGNILSNFEEVCTEWQGFVDPDRMLSNFHGTYPATAEYPEALPNV